MLRKASEDRAWSEGVLDCGASVIDALEARRRLTDDVAPLTLLVCGYCLQLSSWMTAQIDFAASESEEQRRSGDEHVVIWCLVEKGGRHVTAIS